MADFELNELKPELGADLLPDGPYSARPPCRSTSC